MNKFLVYSALAISMVAEGASSVPICAQERAVQTMSLTTLYDLADQQSRKVRVSEVALRAADEGVAAAKSALLPSVDLSIQGSYTGTAFPLRSRAWNWLVVRWSSPGSTCPIAISSLLATVQ